jgi:hypothetical protein
VGERRGRTVQFSVDTGSLGVGGLGPPKPGVMEYDLQTSNFLTISEQKTELNSA